MPFLSSSDRDFPDPQHSNHIYWTRSDPKCRISTAVCSQWDLPTRLPPTFVTLPSFGVLKRYIELAISLKSPAPKWTLSRTSKLSTPAQEYHHGLKLYLSFLDRSCLTQRTGAFTRTGEHGIGVHRMVSRRPLISMVILVDAMWAPITQMMRSLNATTWEECRVEVKALLSGVFWMASVDMNGIGRAQI